MGVGAVVILALLMPVSIWAWRRIRTDTATTVGASPKSSWKLLICALLSGVFGIGFYFAQRSIDAASEVRAFSRVGVLAAIAIVPSALFMMAWTVGDSKAPRALAILGFAGISAWLLVQH